MTLRVPPWVADSTVPGRTPGTGAGGAPPTAAGVGRASGAAGAERIPGATGMGRTSGAVVFGSASPAAGLVAHPDAAETWDPWAGRTGRRARGGADCGSRGGGQGAGP